MKTEHWKVASILAFWGTLFAFLLRSGIGYGIPPGETYHVVAMSGNATFQQTDSLGWRPLETGAVLTVDDSVHVSANAHVVLMSEDGTLCVLSANCRSILRDCMVGNAESRLSNRWSRVLRVLKLVVRNAREGGMISASVRGDYEGEKEQKQLVLLYPRNSAIMQANPTFQWTRVPGALSYEIEISREITPIWTGRTTNESQIEVPPGLLEAGQKYFWTVRANLEDSILEKTAAFRVLPKDSVRLLQETLQRIDTLDSQLDPWAQAQLRALIYATFGAYNDAVSSLIASKLPDGGETDRRKELLFGLLRSMHVNAREVQAFGVKQQK